MALAEMENKKNSISKRDCFLPRNDELMKRSDDIWKRDDLKAVVIAKLGLGELKQSGFSNEIAFPKNRDKLSCLSEKSELALAMTIYLKILRILKSLRF